MTRFASQEQNATALHAVRAEDLEQALATLSPEHQAFARAQGFIARLGQVALLPDAAGGVALVLAGLGDAKARKRGRFGLAAAAGKLPEGVYHLASGLEDPQERSEAALGWLMEGYRFTRYKDGPPLKARLQAPEGVDEARLEAVAAADALGRDMINTPAADLGPAELEQAVRDLGEAFTAEVRSIVGADLLTEGFPLIHAVGRAADRAPRLIELNWGSEGPQIVLVGKGVVFDTGGLNLKPGSSMGLMKKDMGGAASMIALARMIMGAGLRLRLRLLIPAVENAIGAGAFRPGDVLRSRAGLSVEVNNTDAEGRLVLADALCLADEGAPALICSAATLTGAARVALGADIPPFYATDRADATTLAAASMRAADPLWELPFWEPYEEMIEPAIADLDNAPPGGMAGSITAALFLRRFVRDCPRYLHLDIYGHQPANAPGRGKGAAVQGARALFEALPELIAR